MNGSTESNVASTPMELDVKAAPAVAEAKWTRIAGDTALDTMAAVAEEGWADGSAASVVLASTEGYWDALSASALAGALGSPVLLTAPGSLSPQAREQIERLGASKVYVAGGPAREINVLDLLFFANQKVALVPSPSELNFRFTFHSLNWLLVCLYLGFVYEFLCPDLRLK